MIGMFLFYFFEVLLLVVDMFIVVGFVFVIGVVVEVRGNELIMCDVEMYVVFILFDR